MTGWQALQYIYSTRLTRKALSIAGDPTHPSHSFFSLLPSGRRLRSLQARTSRLKDSFIHQAVRKLNSLPSLPPTPSFTPHNTELWHYNPPPPPPPPSSPHPQDLPPPPYKLWPAPVTLCSTRVGYRNPVPIWHRYLWNRYVLEPNQNADFGASFRCHARAID